MDVPGGHKTHSTPTPLVGGLGIFVGILCMSLFAPVVYTSFGPLLFLSGLMLLMGTVDDMTELPVGIRITGHTLITLAMVTVYGVKLETLGALSFGQTEIELGMLATPVTIFATVGVINAVNMSDGIDGLSGGLVLVALGFLAVLAFGGGEIPKAGFIVMLMCSVTAFLSLNFPRPWHHKALVYLGDAGSTMLGFMLAWLLIDSSQGPASLFPPVYALWFLGVPLFDTVNLLIKRPLRGVSPFASSRDHLHHRLLQRGFNVGKVLLVLISVALLFGLIGLAGLFFEVSESFMFLLFLFLFGLYFVVVDKIAPDEATE
jgi:UDP-GlcNAc:undecaprenyl-phosphate GlcNAc-1-phosphate transferase